MSCYEPIVACKTGNKTDSGKDEIKILGPLRSRADLREVPLFDNEMLLPCGHCLGCRLNYSRSWADRMILELDHSKKAIFATLTYDEDHVPRTYVDYTGEVLDYDDGAKTLRKHDLQLFFKRLRKKFPNTYIRFYAAGEYGNWNGSFNNSFRPHYHCIIFGIGLDDLHDLKPVKVNKLKQAIYTCREIREAWSIYHEKEDYYEPLGFVSVGDVSWETCAYVARYTMKKTYGNGHDFLFDLFQCEKEFCLMSRKTGIGMFYPLDHPDMYQYSVLHVAGYPNEITIPRVLVDFLDKEYLYKGNSKKNLPSVLNPLYNPDLRAKIKSERKRFSDDKRFLKFLKTDLDYMEQLDLEYSDKLSKTSSLKRNMDF